MKDNKARAITENKRKMWIIFPVYYMTSLVLLSHYILSSNKTRCFYSQKPLFYSARTRTVCRFASLSERENNTEGERQPSISSKETSYLLSYNNKLIFVSF